MGAMSSCEEDATCCEQPTSSDETESEDDCCLSLCFCSCFGVSVFFDIVDDEKIENRNIPFSTISFFTYQTPLSLIFYSDIWQPPKCV